MIVDFGVLDLRHDESIRLEPPAVVDRGLLEVLGPPLHVLDEPRWKADLARERASVASLRGRLELAQGRIRQLAQEAGQRRDELVRVHGLLRAARQGSRDAG